MSVEKKSEVESFLNDFKVKMGTFDIVFDHRDKNIQALLYLEITALDRKKYISKLKSEDYISGPNDDANDTKRQPYWEFGMSINNKDVYIKISLNKKNKSVLCISFHPAEFKLNYKFK